MVAVAEVSEVRSLVPVFLEEICFSGRVARAGSSASSPDQGESGLGITCSNMGNELMAETDRETDRQAGRHKVRQTDRQTERHRQADRQAGRPKTDDRQTADRQTDRQGDKDRQ